MYKDCDCDCVTARILLCDGAYSTAWSSFLVANDGFVLLASSSL